MTARLPAILRTTPIRLALVLVAVFSVVSLLSLGATYFITQRSFDQAIRADLTQDMAGFASAPGPRALSQLVEAESRVTDPARLVLSYLGPDLRHYGNAVVARDDEGYHIITDIPDSPQIEGDYMALTASLGGGQLTIARSLDEIAALREVFLRVLGLTLIPTILIALGSGLFIARRSAEHVTTIGRTLDTLTGGRLEARVRPAPNWPPDLATIGARIDTMAAAQQAATAAIRQVSSDIAHDLKTPIQRVAVHLAELAERDTLDPPARQALDKANDELDGIVATFHALLQIAQIETGSPKAGFAPVDLATLAADFCELYEPAAADAGHVLTCENTAPIRVLGDRGLLGQILGNLIENALRHTPAGTDIRVAVGRDGPDVILSVTDSGPGVPEEERDLVLRRLYRMDRSRTSPGAGLGLNLVASIATLHGATVTLTDAAPGLRIALRFPPAPH